MLRALKVLESLYVVCVFDQAIYSKDIEIKWKEKEKFKNAVLLMVILYTVTKYMHVFSQRYSHLGLCGILIKVALLQRDLSTKPLVEKCAIEALEQNKLIYEVIISKVILDQVEIGEDIH